MVSLSNHAVKPFVVLLGKEWRELMASRAWWVLLLLMGPLVGVSFISAVPPYAEASGLNGTAVGVGEAFSPLVGIWAPTFSACELAAAFLLPFVAIRVVSGDRQSGALKIELQHPMSAFARVGAKAIVLLAGWLVASLAPFAAVLMWKSYGGNIYAPELATVIVGHLLNAGLTIALAAAMASVSDHPSTAAVIACTFVTASWDMSESRANSFPEADEAALEQIRAPLHIEAHLAPEDPRRSDLEHRALSKLRRVMPRLQVQYVSATSIGLFEQSSQHYGEIWYELGGRKVMSRVTTAEGVLEAIYELAGVAAPLENDAAEFRGHPLAVPPKGAATVFYRLWPALVAGAAFYEFRRHA